jgi:flagellar biogenesis protein FliO
MLQQLSTPIAALESSLGGTQGPDLSGYFTAVLLILGLIALVAFGFRKLVSGTVRERASKRSLQVVDVLPMGRKQRLSVVRCYDRTFLVGQGEKELTLISELDGVIGQPTEVPRPSRADEAAFSRLLDKTRDRIQKALKNPEREEMVG